MTIEHLNYKLGLLCYSVGCALLLMSHLAQAQAHCESVTKRIFDDEQAKVKVTVIAEVHGTNEFPALALNLANHQLCDGRSVILGLEIPRDLQPIISEYLDSMGSDTDRSRLVGEHKFWRGRDGRASLAILYLIESVRVAVRQGQKIGLLAYDAATADLKPYFESKDMAKRRDEFMAHNLEIAAEQNPNAILIVLVGSHHARLDNQPDSMVALLSKRRTIQRIGADVPAGSAWGCRGATAEEMVCGEYPIVEGRLLPDDAEIRVKFNIISASTPARSH